MKDESTTLTKPDEIGHSDKYELSAKQQFALTEMFKGKTIVEAAKAAGIRRQTIYEWKKKCPAFRAALQNHKAEFWHEIQKLVPDLYLNSIITINEAIKGGDTNAAFKILDKSGQDDVIRNEFASVKQLPTTPENEAAKLENAAEAKEYGELVDIALRNSEERLELYEFNENSYAGIYAKATKAEELFEEELQKLLDERRIKE